MPDVARVMVVEDDHDLAAATEETLTAAGYEVVRHARAEPALAELAPDWPGVILSDIRMPGMSGLDFLDHLKEQAPEVPFVVITGHGDVASAVRAMRAGAHDFLEKPCDPNLLIDVMRRAVEMRRLQLENLSLRSRLEQAVNPLNRLVGRSRLMNDLRRNVAALARLDVDLLIAGETGTGKELVARSMHDLSDRCAEPFVAINCGAFVEADIDRELFGIANESIGRIAAAEGGTLYLDELESMPDQLQVRLLRVLESREATPLGGTPRHIDMRIIGSVKGDPVELQTTGRLRTDLYHRFNAGTLELPPLREREEDAVLLIEHFASESATRHDLDIPELSTEFRRQAIYYHWPGNVREARNLAERLVIGLAVKFAEHKQVEAASDGYDTAMERFESRLLQAALLQTGGRKAEAAALLRIPRKRLYLRLKHCGLD